MAVELVSSTTFEAINCGECGVVFALTKPHYESLVANKHTFYCPNGHPRVFLGKSIKAQLAEEQRRVEQLRKSLDLADRTEERPTTGSGMFSEQVQTTKPRSSAVSSD